MKATDSSFLLQEASSRGSLSQVFHSVRKEEMFDEIFEMVSFIDGVLRFYGGWLRGRYIAKRNR